jgi:hypothetical protein
MQILKLPTFVKICYFSVASNIMYFILRFCRVVESSLATTRFVLEFFEISNCWIQILQKKKKSHVAQATIGVSASVRGNIFLITEYPCGKNVRPLAREVILIPRNPRPTLPATDTRISLRKAIDSLHICYSRFSFFRGHSNSTDHSV